MGRVAVCVGGTGMASYELPVHLLNDFTGPDAFDKVAVLALGVNENTFKGKSKRPVIPLLGANLNDAKSIAEALRKCDCTGVTHVYWFLDANRPPKLANAVTMRRLMSIGDMCGPVTRAVLDNSPVSVQERVYGQLAYLAGSGSQPRNIDWLNNMMAALEEVKAPLQNFTMGHGGKHYGMHLGPSLYTGYATPFEEDVHKCVGPLSYFEMQEWVEAKAAEKGFSWNIVRPTFIIGNSPEKTNTTQSFGLVFAIYAHILKAQGKPLVFPGSDGAWDCKIQLSTSKKIAHVAAWASTGCASGLEKHRKDGAKGRAYRNPDDKSVKNQAFNVVSCDEFSWGELWGELAAYFSMASGGKPNSRGGQLCIDVMGGQEAADKTWGELKAKYGLQDLTFTQVFNADFLDKSFTATWDSQFSTKKIAKAGYPKDQVLESEPLQIMYEFLDGLQADKLIPPKPSRASSPRSSKARMGKAGRKVSESPEEEAKSSHA
jgi:hypothetical protein